MKRLSFKLMLLFLVVSTLLTMAGVYATWQYYVPANDALSDLPLGVNEFTYAPPECLYITGVKPVSQSNSIDHLSYDYQFPTRLNVSASNSQAGASVTFCVTVFNNTDVTYWYVGTSYSLGVGSNNMIGTFGGITITTKDKQSDSGETFNTADWVPPRTSRDFYVTYTFETNAMGMHSTYVDYMFNIKMDAVYDGFLAVLNDTTSGFGYDYLDQIFDEKYAEDKSNVIGNVGDDKQYFDNMFGDSQLTVDINGVETPVTVLVERRNLDDKSSGDSSGCEYAVYITVDPLNSPTGNAIVYAVCYSCKPGTSESGGWYQIGQMYEGTAPIQEYDSSNGTYEGAFDVSKWEATPNVYEVGDGITYKVGYEQGDQYDKLKKLSEIIGSMDQDIYNDIDNSRLLKKVYDVLNYNRYSDLPEVVNLRNAFEAAAPYYNIYNSGAEIKIKRDAPRSELIPYIIRIQQAYDYYNQVHD